MVKNIALILFYLLLYSTIQGQEISVQEVKINSIQDDYSPTFYQDGIAITSNKKNQLFQSYIVINPNGTENNLNNIYTYRIGKDSIRLKSTKNSFNINTPNSHEGPCTFSKNYDTIYFAKTVDPSSKKEKSTIGLYFAVKTDGTWGTPSALSFNSSQHNFSHPHLSADGNKLYFVSNLPNGMGGMDIWYVKKEQNNTWGLPVNLGPKINSPYDEVFPFVSQNNILYFSSNSTSSNGTFDIYFIDLAKNDTVKKMPSPINSPYDDYCYISNDNGKSGYFASNRNKTTNDDIFFFNREITFKDCERTHIPKFCFTFFDVEIEETEPHVKHIWNFGNEEGGSYEEEPTHCFQNEGDHYITLSLVDTLTGVVTHDVSSYHLHIPKSNKYHFDKDNILPNEDYLVNIIDFNRQTKTDLSMTWMLEDDYYFDQSDLTIHQKTPGEYRLQSILNDEEQSCIKTDIIVDKEVQNISPVYKILPREKEEGIISDFVQQKLSFSVKKDINYKLSIPNSLKNSTFEWAKAFRNAVSDIYSIDIEVIYTEQENDNFIYLMLSNK